VYFSEMYFIAASEKLNCTWND